MITPHRTDGILLAGDPAPLGFTPRREFVLLGQASEDIGLALALFAGQGRPSRRVLLPVDKYLAALRRAQMEIDLRPELYKRYHLRAVPEKYREQVDVRAFGTGERIVFLPYTREVFAATRQWTEATTSSTARRRPATTRRP